MVGCYLRQPHDQGLDSHQDLLPQSEGGEGMSIKLSGALDSTIMRVGQWTSLTYLIYIHMQIVALTSGLAWCMSLAFTFQNVE
jgi:hypothetical protein